VSHLILYAGYVRNKLAGSPTPQQVEEAQARLKMMELGWPNETPAYGQFYPSLHMPDASAEQSQAFNELLRRTTSPANAVALLQAFYRIDLGDVVPSVSCPTLVLHSRGDSVIWFEQGRSVAGLIPGARFVPLESRNHVLLDTEPAWQQLVEALDDFLPAPTGPAAWSQVLLDELTPRECEVLELVLRVLTTTRSARGSRSASAPPVIMCPSSSASSGSAPGLRRSCALARRVSAAGRPAEALCKRYFISNSERHRRRC
jgi:hypothetical protein